MVSSLGCIQCVYVAISKANYPHGPLDIISCLQIRFEETADLWHHPENGGGGVVLLDMVVKLTKFLSRTMASKYSPNLCRSITFDRLVSTTTLVFSGAMRCHPIPSVCKPTLHSKEAFIGQYWLNVGLAL